MRGLVLIPRQLLIGALAALVIAPAAVAQIDNQKAGAAHPETEDWLRQQIAGWEKHQPAFEGMTQDLAADTRERQADIQAKFDALGAMKSLKFAGVENGADAYLVIFDHGALSWMVGPLADGKAATSLFGGPTIRSGPAPGTEDAVRKLIAGYAANRPAYQIMSESLLPIVVPQQTTLVSGAKELGALKSLTFSKIDARWWDSYYAVYKNGHAVWLIRPPVGGKVDGFRITEVTLNTSTPHADREASVRRYVESLVKGDPYYDDMASDAAATLRLNMPNILAAIKPLGQLQSITFDHSAPGDTDVYLVTFEHGKAEWSIGALTPDGKVVHRTFRVL
jgi:hypothetical protein